MADIDSTSVVRVCHDCKNPAIAGRSRCERHYAAASERASRWRKANPEKARQHRATSYDRHREKVKDRSRAWTAANKQRKAAATAEWARANPDKVLAMRVKRFGLTAEQYGQLLAAQGHRCAICGTDKPGGRGRFAVDHDHQAEAQGVMVVRGLLCLSCNRGLGYFADHADALRRAADYIERTTSR